MIKLNFHPKLWRSFMLEKLFLAICSAAAKKSCINDYLQSEESAVVSDRKFSSSR